MAKRELNGDSEEVKAAIESYKPEALMIIGTSDRMTDIVAMQLGLHTPGHDPADRIAEQGRGVAGDAVDHKDDGRQRNHGDQRPADDIFDKPHGGQRFFQLFG